MAQTDSLHEPLGNFTDSGETLHPAARFPIRKNYPYFQKQMEQRFRQKHHHPAGKFYLHTRHSERLFEAETSESCCEINF
jgi:hypothetical protein